MTEIRKRWFAQLASLTYPQSPGQAAESFKAYMPLLANLPEKAFTTRSLEAVVTSPRKMAIPSYDEVLKPLGAWWRDNRPFQAALPAPVAPDREPVTPEVSAIVKALTGQAYAALGAGTERKALAAETGANVHANHLRDEVLLATLERDAANGTLLATGRLEYLRQKLSMQPGQRA